MFKSEEKPTATNLIRSMKRLGFLDEEIYDTLTNAGLPGGDVQILIDRIETDFEDAEMESQKSRLGKEVEEIVEQKTEKLEIKICSELRKINKNMKEVQNELSSLQDRLIEFQKILMKQKIEKKS